MTGRLPQMISAFCASSFELPTHQQDISTLSPQYTKTSVKLHCLRVLIFCGTIQSIYVNIILAKQKLEANRYII